MPKDRLLTFSDGVLAIIITVMVLALNVHEGPTLGHLASESPLFISYALSFLYIAIYWHNHHHMFQVVTNISGAILWANTNLLFWLSLIPFTTGWMGENHFAPTPTVVYGIILLLCALSYSLLQRIIIKAQGETSELKKAVRNDLKGRISPFLYLLGIALNWLHPWLSMVAYLAVAGMWLIPDTRIESRLPPPDAN